MIERLINSERSYESPEHHKVSEQIVQLKQELYRQLDQQGKEQVDQLTNAYLEQIAALAENSFIEGFCAAVELALDYYFRGKS